MKTIDVDALLKHAIEPDKIKGALLVVPKGYILDAPTIEPMAELKDNLLKAINEVAVMAGEARQKGDNERLMYINGAYNALAAVALDAFGIKVLKLGSNPAYQKGL